MVKLYLQSDTEEISHDKFKGQLHIISFIGAQNDMYAASLE